MAKRSHKFTCKELADRHELLFVRSWKLNVELQILKCQQQRAVSNADDDGRGEKFAKLVRGMNELRAEDMRLHADMIEHALEHDETEETKCKGALQQADIGNPFLGVIVPNTLPPNL
jgi:hypothetical protein